MDGYAVRFSEVAPGGELKVAGRVLAGAKPWTEKIPAGSCVKIMTGAVVPADCDTIVPVESVALVTDGVIRINHPPQTPGQFVRACGEDYPAGTPLLQANQQVTALDVLTLAAAGIPEVTVRRAPDLTLWQTGDEIVPPGAKAAPGQVFNASASYLSVLAKQAGMAVKDRALLPDQPDAVKKRLEQHLKTVSPTHIMLTTGAVSRGDTDFVPGLAADFGYRLLFHRVAIRPGKPIFLAHHPAYGFWLGLPGNPISSFVTWQCFARPLIQHAFGVGRWEWQTKRLLRSAKVPEGLTAFFRGVTRPDGVVLANEQRSAHHAGSLGADVLVRCDGFHGELMAGQTVLTLAVNGH
jgi:molybdopterin molybdotransferase